MRLPSRLLKLALVGVALVGGATGSYFLVDELRTSRLQARHLAEYGRDLRFWTDPGPSQSIRFPKTGPYDERLGYSRLPAYLERLYAHDYAVVAQARLSPRLAELIDRGLNAPYREKAQSGLTVLDRSGRPIFLARYPERVYPDFESVPQVLVQSLLYIENRELLDSASPMRNPAVEWDRLGKAVLDQAVNALDATHETSGGSTLATQIEKYRHSPEGRTTSMHEKLRQVASASVRAYLAGEDTTAVRHQLVIDYLNTVPLAARPGHGEVNGIGNGLWALYDREFDEVNRLLADRANDASRERSLAYKQVLSLLIAQRRPSFYLGGHTEELETLTNAHLRLLARAGVIPPALRDAALVQPLKLRDNDWRPPVVSFVGRKSATAARAHLAALLGVPGAYALDRLDLAVDSTLDERLQQAVTAALHDLRDPRNAKAAGLTEPKLLERGDPAKLTYSFTLYERSTSANRVRVQTDNFNQPLDINQGTKLDLGSTAKLRTLVTYLEIVACLHRQYASRERDELAKINVAAEDQITRWALAYLAGAKDKRLAPMLQAAVERRYSADPGERFFTGGGLHTFENFDPDDNTRVLSVREGLRRSVNLVFIRLMRDIVRFYTLRVPARVRACSRTSQILCANAICRALSIARAASSCSASTASIKAGVPKRPRR